MRISKLGEFGLIDHIKHWAKKSPRQIVGIGDDCAVIKHTKDAHLLLTTDMLLEGVDFKKNTPAFSIGKKAIAISISDIAACGGVPGYCLISLGLPQNSTKNFVKELYRGINYWANKHNVIIAGGDLSKSDKLIISLSMVGFVKKNNLVLRSGAKEGDIIFITGKLGGTIKGKHLDFTPRSKEAQYLVNNYKINSMIDISDGLLQDLGHVTKQSRVGATIYADLIPQSSEAAGLEDALSGGEDFELLFTLSLKEASRLTVSNRAIFHKIGEITRKEKGLRIVMSNGKIKFPKINGYQHF